MNKIKTRSEDCTRIVNRMLIAKKLEEIGDPAELRKSQHRLPDGIRLYSVNSGTFVVTRFVGVMDGAIHPKYEVKFDATGEIYYADRSAIDRGKIKDCMYPRICGIGYTDKDYESIKEQDPELFKVMKSRFNEMINRCYNPNDISYPRYGAIGVRVDKRWHSFCNFYRDIVSMPEFNREDFINTILTLDKDYKQQHIPKGERVYGKDTVTLLSYEDNHQFREREEAINAQRKYFVSISPTGEKILWLGVNVFATTMGFPRTSSQYALDGTYKNVRGYVLRHLTDEEMDLVSKGILKPGDHLN